MALVIRDRLPRIAPLGPQMFARSATSDGPLRIDEEQIECVGMRPEGDLEIINGTVPPPADSDPEWNPFPAGMPFDFAEECSEPSLEAPARLLLIASALKVDADF
jgi:hypothetical protein